MMVMTAKVDMKKIAVILGAIAAVIIAVILFFGGGDAEATSASISSNDARVKFLKDLGWELNASPVESSQVRIPSETTEVFDRYNKLQQSNGYDLSKFAGKNAMRYVYKITNYPNATEPVYATLLVYKNEVIGGDITDTSANGKVQGFKPPKASTDSTKPSEATTPTAPKA